MQTLRESEAVTDTQIAVNQYRPKGSMCAECKNVNADCSKIPFNEMPVIGKDKDGCLVVKCDAYRKKETQIFGRGK